MIQQMEQGREGPVLKIMRAGLQGCISKQYEPGRGEASGSQESRRGGGQ